MERLHNQISPSQLIMIFQNGENFNSALFLKVADMVSDKVCAFLNRYQDNLFSLTKDEKENLRVQVHGLKSALAHVGAMELSKSFKALENLLSQGSYEDFCITLKTVIPDLQFFYQEFEGARRQGFTELLKEVTD